MGTEEDPRRFEKGRKVHDERTRNISEEATRLSARANPGQKGSSMDRVAVTIPRRGILMDTDEMKRQYRTKQEQISKLESERAAILSRGEPIPGRLRYRPEITRVEAEELRMWGHRELVRMIRRSIG